MGRPETLRLIAVVVAIFGIGVVVPVWITESFSTPESRGETAPIQSAVFECIGQGTDCPNGGIRVRFGTTMVQVTRVGDTFLVKDVFGDHRNTGRAILTSGDGRDWETLPGFQVAQVTPSDVVQGHMTTLFRVVELGSMMTCEVKSPTSAHSAGLTVDCDR